MENGIVKFFNNKASKLFGFISSSNGDVFFHLNNGPGAVDGKTRMPIIGDEVTFEWQVPPAKNKKLSADRARGERRVCEAREGQGVIFWAK